MSRWPQKFFVDLRRQEAVGNFLPNQFWPCITFNSYYHCVHLAFSSLKKRSIFQKNKKKCVKGFGGFSEFLASSLPNSEKNAINLFRKHFSHKSLFVISFDYIVPIIALS